MTDKQKIADLERRLARVEQITNGLIRFIVNTAMLNSNKLEDALEKIGTKDLKISDIVNLDLTNFSKSLN